MAAGGDHGMDPGGTEVGTVAAGGMAMDITRVAVTGGTEAAVVDGTEAAVAVGTEEVVAVAIRMEEEVVTINRNRLRQNTAVIQMTSRQEILDQIRLLNERLQQIEYDPEFTPLELIRWRPWLVGTMLHIRHPSRIRRNIFGSLSNVADECELEQFGILTNEGLIVGDEIQSGTLKYSSHNSFEPMLRLPVYCSIDLTHIADFLTGVDLSHLYQTTNCFGVKSYLQGFIPLAKAKDYDSIYISSYGKIPFQTKEFVVDKYPLSRMYDEWKRCREQARTQNQAQAIRYAIVDVADEPQTQEPFKDIAAP